MQTDRGAFHPTRFGDLAVTVDFHCQSACRFCIVREGMNHYRGVPLERFREIAIDNERSGRYERVIFTGGEVTLEARLFDFLAEARGRFAHVELQTNGRRLADRDFARRLREAGADELFVSLHGPSAKAQDFISQREGSFDEAVRGLENARALGYDVTSNTVMSADNVHCLSEMPELLSRLGVRRMELWGYLPMERTEQAVRLIAPLGELVPSLLRCLERAEALSLPATVKYVPRCLLERFGGALDNSQADVVIVESFWDTFPAFNCLYEARCEHSERCLGLSHAYVDKYGWEQDRLRPAARTTPWREPARGAAAPGASARRASAQGPWAALVGAVPEGTPGTLERGWLTRNQARFRYVFDGGASVELVLEARDEARPALLRTRSFNVFYTDLDARGRDAEIKALLEAAARSVERRDDGSFELDARKGLAREHVRRRLPTAR